MAPTTLPVLPLPLLALPCLIILNTSILIILRATPLLLWQQASRLLRLLLVGSENLFDVLQRQIRSHLNRGCGTAQVVDYHAEELVPKLHLILKTLDLLIRADS